jgi:hypothetical protein
VEKPSYRENQNTRFYSVTFFKDNIEKCDRTREAADDNMATRFMLDN